MGIGNDNVAVLYHKFFKCTEYEKEEVLQNPSVFPIGDANVQYAKFL